MKIDLREIYGGRQPARLAEGERSMCSLTNTTPSTTRRSPVMTKDREALLAFFDFPAEHWDHLRTSNPIESVFATVRHGTVLRRRGPVGEDCQAYGVQTRQRRRKNMATIEGRKSVAESRSRHQIPKRHRGHQNVGSPRRLIDLVTQSPA